MFRLPTSTSVTALAASVGALDALVAKVPTNASYQLNLAQGLAPLGAAQAAAGRVAAAEAIYAKEQEMAAGIRKGHSGLEMLEKLGYEQMLKKH